MSYTFKNFGHHRQSDLSLKKTKTKNNLLIHPNDFLRLFLQFFKSQVNYSKYFAHFFKVIQ